MRRTPFCSPIDNSPPSWHTLNVAENMVLHWLVLKDDDGEEEDEDDEGAMEMLDELKMHKDMTEQQPVKEGGKEIPFPSSSSANCSPEFSPSSTGGPLIISYAAVPLCTYLLFSTALLIKYLEGWKGFSRGF